MIIYPARIEPRKGQLDALKLIQELLNKDVDADLYLYGDIRETFLPELERVITTFSLRDKVYINPQIPHEELIQCYQKSDICFFPSYWEDGLSRVPMEAMASGCIVISYGNEGSNEIIRNRENGFLVHAGHYDEIIRIIKELLSDPELVKSIQQQARKDIEDKYSIQKYIDKVEKQLTQMIENA